MAFRQSGYSFVILWNRQWAKGHLFFGSGVTIAANCGISYLTNAVRGLLSGLRLLNGPPMAFST
jgi:hypothetical protein